MGLCFTSKYVFAKYDPITPTKKSCIPATKSIIVTVDAQPVTALPYNKCLITIKHMEAKDANDKIIPTIELKTNGAVEKAIIPSKA